MECICSAEELAIISNSELQKRIEQGLQYDEYRYQQANNILIRDKKRAEGLHKALYKCRTCGEENLMTSEGTMLKCKACGSSWELSEDGWLRCEANTASDSDDRNNLSKIHIPDWYEWQRSEVIKTLSDLQETYDVRIEALPNEYGFVNMGDGKLTLDANGFVLQMSGETFYFPHKIRESVQTEYNYRGRGMCIVLSTRDCCYYIYSDDERFQPTRFQFIGEYLFEKSNGECCCAEDG